MRALSRAWQILFKGGEEVKTAGNGLQAAEMVLVRLAYASELPSPDEIIGKLQNTPAGGSSTPSIPHRGTVNAGSQALRRDPEPRYDTAAQPVAVPQTVVSPRSYLELVALAGEKRDIALKIALETQMRPVSFREKSIEVALVEGANPAVIQTLSAKLREWTGQIWGISVSTAPATGPTIRDVKEQVRAKVDAEAVEDPLVKAILERFPGSKVTVKLQEEQIPDTAYEDAFFEEREDD
jgi:DNA polymerase-3 subunit gamma/tau